MHLAIELPRSFAPGAKRRREADVSVVPLDSGKQVRNLRRDSPIRVFEVPFPNRRIDHPDFQAVMRIWEESEFGVHTFLFYDWIAEELVTVWFDDFEEVINHIAGPFHQHDSFTLREA